jgi:hypothetical protein
MGDTMGKNTSKGLEGHYGDKCCAGEFMKEDKMNRSH